MSRRLPASWPLALALLVPAAGCQRGDEFVFAPVSGTITKNGVPLAGVRVIFYADSDVGTRGPRAMALTDAAGRYQLRTDAGDDGAVTGTHVVCLLESANVGAFIKERFEKQPDKAKALADTLSAADPGARTAGPRLPPEYGRIGESPLRAEVHPGAQTIDFAVP